MKKEDDYIESDFEGFDTFKSQVAEFEYLQGQKEIAEDNLANIKERIRQLEEIEIPSQFLLLGISELKTESGKKIKLTDVATCSPNKNDKDKAVLAEWLRKNGGGYLLDEKLIIKGKDASDEISRICREELDVPYIKSADVNTASLKAFLKEKIGQIGYDGEPITAESIPSCAHYYVRRKVVLN